VSDNYTVRNKDLISKHVFAGNTRLVSKTVMREEKSGKMTATEQGAYYYHPDHLGSSNVVTDKDGKFYEQIEYMPYGETWINNKATAEQTSSPYKFTAKEYDPETGLYYYGARYYDAKLSRWCSADDRFDGLYSSQGMDVFAYVRGNPVKYNDPTGHFLNFVVGAAIGMGAEYITNKMQGKETDWKDLAIAGGVGALSGGVGGSFVSSAVRKGFSKFFATAIASGTASSLYKGLKNYKENKPLFEGTGSAFLFGSFLGGLTSKVADKLDLGRYFDKVNSSDVIKGIGFNRLTLEATRLSNAVNVAVAESLQNAVFNTAAGLKERFKTSNCSRNINAGIITSDSGYISSDNEKSFGISIYMGNSIYNIEKNNDGSEVNVIMDITRTPQDGNNINFGIQYGW